MPVFAVHEKGIPREVFAVVVVAVDFENSCTHAEYSPGVVQGDSSVVATAEAAAAVSVDLAFPLFAAAGDIRQLGT